MPSLRNSGSRRRRTRDELRTMMLDAGRDVLAQLEPNLGFEGLTYSTVFAHLLEERNEKVTIGSVHERLWASQRDFQLDVVASALTDPVSEAVDRTGSVAMQIMEEADLSTPASRRYTTQTIARLTSPQTLGLEKFEATKLIHAVRFRLWAMGPDHPEAAGFFDTICMIREDSIRSHAELIQAGMDIVGLRVRPEAGDPTQAVEDIAIMSNAAHLGLQTDVLNQARTERYLPTGPNGEDEPWLPDAIAIWAVMQSTLELDDDDLSAAERRL